MRNFESNLVLSILNSKSSDELCVMIEETPFFFLEKLGFLPIKEKIRFHKIFTDCLRRSKRLDKEEIADIYQYFIEHSMEVPELRQNGEFIDECRRNAGILNLKNSNIQPNRNTQP